jgi:hypothetical protein
MKKKIIKKEISSEKKERVCGVCGHSGHNSRRCELKKEIVIKQEEIKEAADEIVPQKGLWIIQPCKQILVGKITKVFPTGVIRYTSVNGAQIESAKINFLKGGYTFIDIEPEHLKYKMGLV